MRRSSLLAVASTLAVAVGAVSAAPPKLEYLFPAGGQRGTTFVTTCSGEFSWPVEVWAPGATVHVLPDAGKLEFTIPDDLPSDQLWLRLYNSEGSSAVLPLLVGERPEAEEQEPNNSPRDAQAIKHGSDGVTLNGVLQESGDVDGFALELAAGQTLVAAVDANTRLGSPMDAMLQVTSDSGTVLAANHDAVGLDPRIVFTASRDGTYIVRLFAFAAEPDTNISYRGAPSYVYRLTMTTGPYVTHPLPLSVHIDQSAIVRALGWNIPSDAALSRVPHEAAAVGEQLVDETARDVRVWPDARLGLARATGWPGSTPVRLIAHASSALEPPSADSTGQPALLELPTTVTGCLSAEGEVDQYRVNLSAGQHIVVAAEAPSLQLPTAPIVQLLDAAGAVAAETQNSGPVKDAILAHSTKTDSAYVIGVRDRFRRGGDRYWYQLSVHADHSNVQLTADADAIIVKPDAPAELNVTVERHAAPSEPLGEIKLEAIDLPAGVTAEPVVSAAEGPTAEKVTVRFVSTGPAFSGPIRIRATTGEPLGLTRFVRVPSKYPTSTAAIWLTVVEAE